MAWTSPMTATSGSVFTASQFNTNVRDNGNQTGPALVSAAGQILVSTAANALAARTPQTSNVDTSQTTASNTYTDLATAGPAVTVTSGTQALVTVTCQCGNSLIGGAALMGFAVSVSTTIAASDLFAVANGFNAGGYIWASAHFLVTGLTSGSNTFTAKYKAANTGTATFVSRKILVVPL